MTGPPPPPDGVWVDGRLVVRESSIEGRGLFFTEDVPAGTSVIRLGGRLVSSDELEELIAENVVGSGPYVDTISVDEDSHLVLPPGTDLHFGNHSCDPTLWHVGPYELATRRDVSAGDEATMDYGTNSAADGFEMECDCRSTDCRGRVTSADWQLPDLQHRYRGHWAPVLQHRIDAT